ncbi:hypothetical protein K7W42_12645 [Deinococcus sp. HMF7604]|uniref:hypothetical protein n=1 Tax=Deinococcus betulae TaxID=2873312 RepID=UPI001CCD5C47|nr:hypothetical protein [Deinococcus betulae]MBZ9751711.1 hypothetical protein [Deinococcus betulae]
MQQAGEAVHDLDDELRERLAWTQARAEVDARALLITAGQWAAQQPDAATGARLAEVTRDLNDLISVAAELVALTQPHLLWTAAKSGVCPVCSGVVRAQPTALHIGFPGRPSAP